MNQGRWSSLVVRLIHETDPYRAYANNLSRRFFVRLFVSSMRLTPSGLTRYFVPDKILPLIQILHAICWLVNVVHGVVDVEFTRWGYKTLVLDHLFQFAGFIVHDHDG